VAADLQEHVRSRLARYKAPRHVFVTAQLPSLPTGKIDKKLLRACYAAGASAEQAVEISGYGGKDGEPLVRRTADARNGRIPPRQSRSSPGPA
jgi:hypothetical protein